MANGVFEMHGVWATGDPNEKGTAKWVSLREVGTDRVEVSYVYSGEAPQMTGEQARYLGLKLLRLARRIEGRKA